MGRDNDIPRERLYSGTFEREKIYIITLLRLVMFFQNFKGNCFWKGWYEYLFPGLITGFLFNGNFNPKFWMSVDFKWKCRQVVFWSNNMGRDNDIPRERLYSGTFEREKIYITSFGCCDLYLPTGLLRGNWIHITFSDLVFFFWFLTMTRLGTF